MATERDWKETVRALLTKAQARGVTQQESEAYFAKAASIMAAKGIDQALLAEEDSSKSDQPADKIITIPGPFAREKAELLQRIALALRCQAVRLWPNKAPYRVHVFGWATDIERLEMLYTSLLFQAGRFMSEDMPAPWEHRETGDKRGAMERAWLTGFSEKVAVRLRAIERHAQENAPKTSSTGRGTDLVLLDRAQVIEGKYREAYPTTTYKSRTLRGRGYYQGSNAGNRADLGQKRFGSDRKELSR